MKSSAFIAVYGTLVAAASAAVVDKRLFETETSTAWTTVYVTEGESKPTGLPVPNINQGYKFSKTATIVAPKPTTSAYVAKPSTYQSEKPTSTQGGSPTPTDYASTAIYHHNIHRANHSAPNLEWSEEHASYAAQTAQKCKFAHDLSPGGGGYGQNLAMWGSSGDAKGLGSTEAAAQGISGMWYNGELGLFPTSSYGKDNPDMSGFESWGHFTQMVWAGSSKVGCHSQYCPAGTMYQSMGSWFTVCNYHPAGNMGGSYGKNVKPPQGAKIFSA